MTSKTRQVTAPEWRQFLRLGEQLSNQPDPAAQCALIIKTVKGRLACNVEVMLMEPYYPLPGETEINIIPQTSLKNLEKRVNDFRILQQHFLISPSNKENTTYSRIIPIQTQNDLLGVLYVERGSTDFTRVEEEFLEGFVAHAALAMQITRQIVLKNWRSEQLALVQSVSEQIANIFDLDQLCQHVTRLIQKTFNYYHIGIYTLEEQHENLRLRASANLSTSTEYVPIFNVKLEEGIIGNVAQTGIELLAQNVREESHYRYIDALPETQAEYALPLKIEEKILGVLDAQSDRVNSFHELDQLVLRSLANNIALAIENGRLYNRARQRADQISLVIDFNHALSSILDLEELVAKVVQLIQGRFGYPFVHYFSIQPVRRKILYETGSGAKSGILEAQKLSFDLDDSKGLIPRVAREGKSILANDVVKEDLYRDNPNAPTGTRSELTVPVIFAGTVLGILDIQSDQINAFDENDQSIIEALTAGIAIAVRNATLYRSEKWRVQVADSFRDVALLISSNATLDELLGSVLDKLESNLPCEASAIWLLEDPFSQSYQAPQSLKLAAVRGIDAEKINLALQDPEISDWLSKAMTNPEPTIRNPNDPYGPLGKALDFPPDYSSIGAPLRSGDQSLGILTLAHHTSGRYGGEAHDMVTTFASYAAISIQNARLFADAQEQAWVSTVLLQVSEASQSLTSIEELLDTMVRLPPLLIGVKLCAYYLWDDSFQGFTLKASYGIENLDPGIIYYEHETPAFARLNSTRSATIIEDPAEELKIPASALPGEKLIFTMLPLLSRGNLLGGFFVGYRPAITPGEEPLSQQIIAILQGISHQAATALENLRLEEAREEEAYVTAVLLEVAQAVVSQNDLHDILDTVIHLLPILVGIDTCVIYTWDQEGNRYLPIRAFSDSAEEETALLSLPFLKGEFELMETVFESNQFYFSASEGEDIPIANWREMQYFPQENLSLFSSQIGYTLLLAFPLFARGQIFGVMLAKEKVTNIPIRERRLEIINGIAQQIALAIQNDRYKKELVETERMEREFQLARESQKTFLPERLPQPPGWELDAIWQPARHVGGDFYDIIELDKDHLGFVIADVSDKGMPAALYMTVTRTLIRAIARSSASPNTVLEQVNNLLIPDNQSGMFVTAIYAILTPKTGQLVYANAGHNLPLLLKGKNGDVETLPKGGIALGVLENIHLEEHFLKLDVGDYLLFYTDGVTDALSPGGDSFGEMRLSQTYGALRGSKMGEVLNALSSVLEKFRGNDPPFDDITLMGIHRIPRKTRLPAKVEDPAEK